jgi:hypothetical protein
LGFVSLLIPPELVDDVLGSCERLEQRFRSLPSRFGVYFILGLCLHRSKSHTAVLRAMLGFTARADLREHRWTPPSSTALAKLRDRIGALPLQRLFTAMTRPATTRVSGFTHAFGLLLCAWDGTEIALADTTANRERYRRHRGRDGDLRGAPKARLLVLLTCGTRQLLGATIGDLGQGETTLATALLGRLRPGMLLLGDRNFLGYHLWTQAAATGADLLWRARNNRRLPVVHAHCDGSFRSRILDPAGARALRHNINRNRKRGHRPPRPPLMAAVTVRVIEAMITVTTGDGVTRTERYRLVTTLLDPRRYPAAQIVELYARRWAAETGIKDLKIGLLHGRAVRGTTPIRARQEIWAALIVYQSLKLHAAHAALAHGLDPARISFTAVRDAAQETITLTHHEATAYTGALHAELAEQLITKHTTYRVFPRTVTTTPTRYPRTTKTRQPGGTTASYRVQITTPTPAQPRAT